MVFIINEKEPNAEPADFEQFDRTIPFQFHSFILFCLVPAALSFKNLKLIDLEMLVGVIFFSPLYYYIIIMCNKTEVEYSILGLICELKRARAQLSCLFTFSHIHTSLELFVFVWLTSKIDTNYYFAHTKKEFASVFADLLSYARGSKLDRWLFNFNFYNSFLIST